MASAGVDDLVTDLRHQSRKSVRPCLREKDSDSLLTSLFTRLLADLPTPGPPASELRGIAGHNLRWSRKRWSEWLFFNPCNKLFHHARTRPSKYGVGESRC